MSSHPGLHADARASFVATMGFQHQVSDHAATGTATMGPYLCEADGWPGMAALLTFADVLIGRLASERTAPRISVTADLSVRVFAPLPPGGRLEMDGALIKTGRSMSVGETHFRASGSGAVIGTAVGTFLASPRPVDQAPEGFGDLRVRQVTPAASTLSEHVGLQVRSAGVAELALRPDLLNATESLQGGLVALLGEVAGRTAASEAAGVPQVVDSLDVYYLAAARVGPFQTAAQVLTASPERCLVRVEVLDPGYGNRCVSLTLVGTRRLP